MSARADRRLRLVAPLPLNEAQEDVLHSAMRAPLTVATGPPGTGKSQLIVNVVATAYAAGESVLLASTNNAAVDVVADRAAEAKLRDGLVVRTGKAKNRENAQTQLERLASEQPTPADIATTALGMDARHAAFEDCRAGLDERADVEAELYRQLGHRQELAAALGWRLDDLPAVIQDGALRERAHRATSAGLLGRWLRARLVASLGLDASPETVTRLAEFLDAEHAWRAGQRRDQDLPPAEALWERLRTAQARHQEASGALVDACVAASLLEGQSHVQELADAASKTDRRHYTAFREALPGRSPGRGLEAGEPLRVSQVSRGRAVRDSGPARSPRRARSPPRRQPRRGELGPLLRHRRAG
ncbi:MAG: AAA domain-containing protein [Egibacteraceae bacterium]